MPFPGNSNVFITRLHLRYTPDKFPEDLRFQNTANQELFQGRYVLRRPYRGEMNCTAANTYRQTVQKRQREEAKTLANLTGWPLGEIEDKINYLEGPGILFPGGANSGPVKVEVTYTSQLPWIP
ncbi:hypothetical protein NON20_21550 [Synechocystis sp. B12]|nr:hypothetical protein NON20_21550 [Synechocystis sp. B12]